MTALATRGSQPGFWSRTGMATVDEGGREGVVTRSGNGRGWHGRVEGIQTRRSSGSSHQGSKQDGSRPTNVLRSPQSTE